MDPGQQQLNLKKQSGADGDLLVLEGVLDENAEPKFKELHKELANKIVIDLGGVWRINSVGVMLWLAFMRSLGTRKVAFRRCHPVIVEQLNTVMDFRGMAKIESILAPYFCSSCNREQNEELVIGRDVSPTNLSQFPARKCSQCHSAMQFDDIPDRYLGFLAYV